MNSRITVFAYGFRPFFLVAGVWALLSLGAWLWLYTQGIAPLPQFPPQYWHAHEMLFGTIAAAVAGFLLTAVPSWTGQRGFGGWPLVALFLLWFAGRFAFLTSALLPAALLVVLELSFLPALMATIAPALVRVKNRNTPLLLVLLALWVADVAFVIGVVQSDPALSAMALRGALDLVLLLVTIIGGRIVPAFTANALRARGMQVNMTPRVWLNRVAIALMCAFLVVDLAIPHAPASAVIAGLAAVVQLWRLAGWNGLRSFRDPIVWILHVGYAWLPLGLALRALHGVSDIAFAVHWQHALGAGVGGTMIMAVMTRAALGHTGREIKAHPLTTAAYVALTAAVALRVFGPAFSGLNYQVTVLTAGALWMLAFALYLIVYLPILLTPRADGKPG